jgi:hypothetical protein
MVFVCFFCASRPCPQFKGDALNSEKKTHFMRNYGLRPWNEDKKDFLWMLGETPQKYFLMFNVQKTTQTTVVSHSNTFATSSLRQAQLKMFHMFDKVLSYTFLYSD